MIFSSSANEPEAPAVTYRREVLRDQIAKVLHGSRTHVLAWDDLPDSPLNPQRFYARKAALDLMDAFVIAPKPELALVQGEARSSIADAHEVMSAAVDTLTVPPVPEALCGASDNRRFLLGGSCVYLKNHEGKHSWE